MNVFKPNWMKNYNWSKLPYDEFLSQSQQETILELEYASYCNLEAVAVLNTLLFCIIDNKGREFYENNFCPLPPKKQDYVAKK